MTIVRSRVNKTSLEVAMRLVIKALKACDMIAGAEAWWAGGIDKAVASQSIDTAINYLNHHILKQEVK